MSFAFEVVPNKSAKVKSRRSPEVRCDSTKMSDDLCPRTDRNASRSSDPHSSGMQTKVPSFVLHPAGTHYIPICLDASVVAQAFPNPTTNKGPTSQPLQCHPVSIPVNFHRSANLNAGYVLDVQHINVKGSIHQPRVRPHTQRHLVRFSSSSSS